MWILKQLSTGMVVYEGEAAPVFRGGMWQVPNANYTDDGEVKEYAAEETQLIPLIGPIAFQMLFTVEELVAIDAAKAADAAIRIFWKLLDDPRTDYVDRNLGPIKDMLRSLEAGGLIGLGRAEEILTGQVMK